MSITRLSPITLGCLVLAIIVFGAVAYIMSRPRRHDAASLVPHGGDSLENRSPGGARPLRFAERPEGPAPIPPALPRLGDIPVAEPATSSSNPAAADSPTLPTSPTVVGNDKVAIKDRQLLIATHNLQLVQQADERVFEALKIPDSTRVAIRKIDEEYGNKTRATLNVNPDSMTIDRQIGLGIAANEEAERTRRAAMKDVLGAEAAQEFLAAEYAETRRLRIQYRKQWAEELDENAPRPPGMPRSPH